MVGRGDHYYSVRLNKVTEIDFFILIFFIVRPDSYRAFLPR